MFVALRPDTVTHTTVDTTSPFSSSTCPMPLDKCIGVVGELAAELLIFWNDRIQAAVHPGLNLSVANALYGTLSLFGYLGEHLRHAAIQDAAARSKAARNGTRAPANRVTTFPPSVMDLLKRCPNPMLHPEILQGWVSDARSVAMCRRGLQAVYNAANEAIVQGSGSAPGGAGYSFIRAYPLFRSLDVRLASGNEAETMFDEVSAARHSQARLAFRRELETVELGDCAEEVIAGFVSRAPRLSDLR